MSLYLVFLRRPRNQKDKRRDPFWEFGSFGRTGCHRNLLRKLVKGDRLAFLQGGDQGIRVVGVTPTIVPAVTEARWESTYRPLPYSDAPLFINNEGCTEFPEVFALLKNTARLTWVAKAASRLRSRTTPVDGLLEKQILLWFEEVDIPRITVYSDAIEHPTGVWHINAMSEGWADLSDRQKEYEECLPPSMEPVDTVNNMPLTKVRKGSRPPC